MPRGGGTAPGASGPDGLPKIWVARDAYATMLQEATARHPLETGGVLVGYLGDGEELVVTTAVGPGAAARHGRSKFVPDHAFHEEEVARLYKASGRRWTYVGDWHSHPDAPAYMSPTDSETLELISSSKAARAPRPIMLILGQREQRETSLPRLSGREWYIGAWRFLRRRTFYARLARQGPTGVHAAACKIIVFDAEQEVG